MPRLRGSCAVERERVSRNGRLWCRTAHCRHEIGAQSQALWQTRARSRRGHALLTGGRGASIEPWRLSRLLWNRRRCTGRPQGRMSGNARRRSDRGQTRVPVRGARRSAGYLPPLDKLLSSNGNLLPIRLKKGGYRAPVLAGIHRDRAMGMPGEVAGRLCLRPARGMLSIRSRSVACPKPGGTARAQAA